MDGDGMMRSVTVYSSCGFCVRVCVCVYVCVCVFVGQFRYLRAARFSRNRRRNLHHLVDIRVQ